MAVSSKDVVDSDKAEITKELVLSDTHCVVLTSRYQVQSQVPKDSRA